MKILATIFLLTVSFGLFAQDKILGHYRDYFGSSLQLNADSTFKYTWHFDLSASWTKGTWTVKKDTVYFRIVPTYDTISSIDNKNTAIDKLILSDDEISERLTHQQWIGRGLSSGGQNKMPYPEKLFYKKERLYGVKDGRLYKKKNRGIWSKKYFPPWFFKSND
jgi:hypothetical protein